MSNTIQGTPAAPPANASTDGGALPVSPYGGAEAVIDRAVQQLEQQRVQAREMQRDARREQRAAEERQLDDERDAAKWRLAGGLMNAGGQAVQGGLGVASAGADGSQADALGGWGQVAGASGGGLSSVADFVASDEEIDAKAAGQEAASLREVAQDHAADADRIQRLQDKALSHRERVADARLQAQLRSSG